MRVTCPTGLSFQARKWNLSDVARAAEHMEEEQNADRGSGRKPEHANLLLEMCQAAVLGEVTPGPYQLTPSGGVSWLGITNQDLIAALVQIRRMTKPVIETDLPCRYCRKLQPEGLTIDLAGIEIYVASADGIAAIQSGLPYELKCDTTEGEATLKIRPVYARDNTRMAALQREEPARLIEIANCMSVQEIVVSGRKIDTLPEIRGFYGQQDWDFADLLDKTIEDLFGGPDTSFTFSCGHSECGMEQRAGLPLDASFWGLGGRRRKRRRISLATTSAPTATTGSSSTSSPVTPKSPT